MNGQPTCQRPRRGSVNFPSISSFLSVSCPIPVQVSLEGQGRRDTPPGLVSLKQQNLIGTAFIASPSFSRRMVSFKGHKGWG